LASGGGSATDAHLEVDAAAAALVAVSATRSLADGSAATGTSTRLVGVSDPQHRRHHQQPCLHSASHSCMRLSYSSSSRESGKMRNEVTTLFHLCHFMS